MKRKRKNYFKLINALNTTPIPAITNNPIIVTPIANFTTILYHAPILKSIPNMKFFSTLHV